MGRRIFRSRFVIRVVALGKGGSGAGKGAHLASVVSLAVLLLSATAAPAVCTGDCNDDSQVTIDEIVAMSTAALTGGSACVSPHDCSHGIDVACLLKAIDNALTGCRLPFCGGDCNGDRKVDDTELALCFAPVDGGNQPPPCCGFDDGADRELQELALIIVNLSGGCDEAL